VTQPRISHLSRRQIDRFSVDALLNMATLAGLQIEIAVRAT
jgi:predicted XRE-type DNA-binding protein